MLLLALALGVVLIVAAIRNSQGALFAALKVDVPAYVVWAAAILAVGAIGFVPGLKPVSRGLLALVFVVLIMRNYQAMIAGFQSVASGQASGGSANQAPDSANAGIPGLGGPIGTFIGQAVGATVGGMTESDVGQSFSAAGVP